MPPDRVPCGNPADWLRRAESDLILAREARTLDVLLEDLCFHAQQSVEKALKAILISHSIPASRTHNIRTLIDTIPKKLAIPDRVQEASILSDYAVMARYPGDVEPVEEKEYLEAVELAEFVLSWAKREIQSSSE